MLKGLGQKAKRAKMKNEELLIALIALLEAELKPSERAFYRARFSGFSLFRALVNTRPAKAASNELLALEKLYLQSLLEERGIVKISPKDEKEPNIFLLQADITKLKCEAIVNAANEALLGCFAPCHSCVDNAIFTFAGIKLRLECSNLMQGAKEKIGRAKITKAYNLPSKYIIHTVGPAPLGRLTKLHKEQLASSYTSCLDLALLRGLKEIAFCCISTGVFGFPQEEAAKIAVEVARKYSKKIRIIFNVYLDEDHEIYEKLLR